MYAGLEDLGNGLTSQHGANREAATSDNILQFQLRKETAKLNPEAWLGR